MSWYLIIAICVAIPHFFMSMWEDEEKEFDNTEHFLMACMTGMGWPFALLLLVYTVLFDRHDGG